MAAMTKKSRFSIGSTRAKVTEVNYQSEIKRLIETIVNRNYKVINDITNKSINQTDRLNDIFKRCNLELYDNSIQSVIKNTITDMYFGEDFAKKVSIPKTIVQQRLESMDMYAIDRALANYKNAVDSGTEITAPKSYFEKCLWTAINDDKLDLFGVNNIEKDQS